MHVVMMVMVMPMVMMPVVVVMMMLRLGHRSSRRRSGFLRNGVTSEAERERGGCNKGLDHGKVFLRLGNPSGSLASINFSG